MPRLFNDAPKYAATVRQFRMLGHQSLAGRDGLAVHLLGLLGPPRVLQQVAEAVVYPNEFAPVFGYAELLLHEQLVGSDGLAVRLLGLPGPPRVLQHMAEADVGSSQAAAVLGYTGLVLRQRSRR